MFTFHHLRIPLCAFALLFFNSSNLFAQDVGVPSGTTFFNTGTSSSVSGGQLGHLQTGSFGNLSGGNSWIALGKPQIGGTGLPVYGLRIQDDGYVGLMSLNQSGSIRDLSIAWGSDLNSVFEIDFINDQTGDVPNTNIMTANPNGNVGFGTTNPIYRLEVLNESTSPSPYAIYSENNRPGSTICNYARGNFMSVYGNSFEASTSLVQFGVYGRSFRIGTSGVNYGIFGFSGGGGTSYGISGVASSMGTGTKIGVRGSAPIGTGNFAGFFTGDLTYTGTFTHTSDRRLKESIETEVKALDRIMQLRPTTYVYTQQERFSSMNLADGLQHGFIAQELEEVIPEAVHDGVVLLGDQVEAAEAVQRGEQPDLERFEYKSVDYISLIPILTKGIQEQQSTIEEVKAENVVLKAELAELEAQVEELRAAVGMPAGKGVDAGLDTEVGNVLFANAPNPFSEATTIRYQVTPKAATAQLLVFDMNGRQVRSYDLKGGENSLTINGSDLEAGMYFYSLIVDGGEVDTKRMILTK